MHASGFEMDLNFNNGAASLQQQLSLAQTLPPSLTAPLYAAGVSASASASASLYSQLQLPCTPCALSVSAMPLENGDLSANVTNNGAAGVTPFAACTSRAPAPQQQQQFSGAAFAIASQSQQFPGPLFSATSPALQAQQLSQMAQVCSHTMFTFRQIIQY